MELSMSNEDYLEAILILEKKYQVVKSVDIARFLNVSKPGVTKAMNILKDLGLINKESYSSITLTTEGRKIANIVYEKHLILHTFLTKLGVSDEIAEKDCCKIEHILSDETLECIIKYVKNN